MAQARAAFCSVNCDPLARWYQWLESIAFGCSLKQRREQFLPDLGKARHALVLGDGDGRFTAALLRTNRSIQVHSVDNSEQMLFQARQRVFNDEPEKNATRIDFQLADARSWRPPAHVRYDLVVTHFFLDCFTTDELAPIIERIAAVTTPDARWIVSEFRQPESGLAAWRAKLWIRVLYWLFGLTTGLRVTRLPDYSILLERGGFRRVRSVTSQWGLLVSECWQRG